MQWFIKVVTQYADFQGRARRSEYWFYILFYIIGAIVIGLIDSVATGGILTMLYSFGLLLPSLAVLVRRLHDTDRTGWWVLIGFVPLVGAIVLLVFACIDGTPGDNRFGPSPKSSSPNLRIWQALRATPGRISGRPASRNRAICRQHGLVLRFKNYYS